MVRFCQVYRKMGIESEQKLHFSPLSSINHIQFTSKPLTKIL